MTWILKRMTSESLEEFRQMPLYKYINERLTEELSDADSMDEWFNRRLDPDMVAVLAAEACTTEDAATGFVTGFVVGIMASEYRAGENNDEAG